MNVDNSNRFPDGISNSKDPGDDIQRRFRFQAAYAASLSLQLLLENSDYEVIYCEQVEDILVKLKSGKYIGIQVKSREVSGGPFRFRELEIRRSIVRFVRHEIDFPDQFRSYLLCTNCGFPASRDSSNLVYCLETLRKHLGSNSCYGEIDFEEIVDAIAADAKCSPEFVLRTLVKVTLLRWADLENYDRILVGEIAVITKNADQPYDALYKLADHLISVMEKAAALSSSLGFPSYYLLLKDPASAIQQSVISNKRITSQIVQESLNQFLHSTVTLRGLNPIQISELKTGTTVMALKMARGGIDPQNIDLMKDLNASSEVMFLQWLHKYGTEEANRRAEHLRLIVQTECQEAHDLSKNSVAVYGSRMLQEVRERLRAQHNDITTRFADCTYNHLLGIAGILTEDCKIWWCDQFPLPTGTES